MGGCAGQSVEAAAASARQASPCTSSPAHAHNHPAIPPTPHPPHTQQVSAAAFDLLFAFDEVISTGGCKEYVTVSQVGVAHLPRGGGGDAGGLIARPTAAVRTHHHPATHTHPRPPTRPARSRWRAGAPEHGDGEPRGEAAQDDHSIQDCRDQGPHEEEGPGD